jgi:hypothetical protein
MKKLKKFVNNHRKTVLISAIIVLACITLYSFYQVYLRGWMPLNVKLILSVMERYILMTN